MVSALLRSCYLTGLGYVYDSGFRNLSQIFASAVLMNFFFIIVDFWNNSDTESEVDLQLSTGGFDQDDDDDFDFYG